jgi:hypothetical protein
MATHSALTKGAWIEGDRLESLRKTLVLAAPMSLEVAHVGRMNVPT